MNVNKKLGRFKQWAGERMGQEAKTGVTNDFKSLEVEMALRQEGMERLQKSTTNYVKTLSKRNEGDDKEKSLPVANLGTTMVSHGEDFEDDSEFGQCLQSLGRANERIGRVQENYTQNATTSWLDSLERSLTQMKEYNAARKKLESRRLAYDAATSKMQKSKRDDFRVEEELRSAKAKYEESTEDVYRRMEDIKEAEADSIVDLGSLLDAELRYYDRCRDILLQVKETWPGRQNDANGIAQKDSRYSGYEDDDPPDTRRTIKSSRTASNHMPPEPQFANLRPTVPRAATFEGPRQLQRDDSPVTAHRVARVPSDNITVKPQRDRLQALATREFEQNDRFSDPSDESTFYESPDRPWRGRSASPATSVGSNISRQPSYSALDNVSKAKKAPPPPPPSRAKKPPPPPPPMKRSALSNTPVSYA
ncbi:uncharacterized protein KY384_003824 [Bacidia gigantensis]|uniref:uncharacterized protein n=1 Tax=Bacidia gigantensis TaxID=2732470 RepID=UPI001D0404EA|nr:uncharacterized protein KY384_003824 [Bacidia gigantensis]KAG8532184.1 hypothetical protein KY384_003824 [Bacidia gigantensis]